MADVKKYAEKDFSKVRGLTGISNPQIEEHLKLYAGYVKRTNALTEKLYGICSEGKASGAKYETWLSDFRAIATMPGIGWVVTYQDPSNGWISNHWITLHETNNIAGFHPVLVMDGWEHAFMRDYQATERAKYVDAFFKNVDWAACEKRLK
jgi:Fe-Mn family superoxide dismutase